MPQNPGAGMQAQPDRVAEQAVEQQAQALPQIDEQKVDREIAELVETVPAVEGLAGLDAPVAAAGRPGADRAGGTSAEDTATRQSQSTKTAEMQAITKRLAELIQQVPPPDGLIGLDPPAAPLSVPWSAVVADAAAADPLARDAPAQRQGTINHR